ncbi:MAG: thymidine phosphorylase [Synergistaceae bacterium]|nr:thymidine phosphorylase [Synergistaceae bacterium]
MFDILNFIDVKRIGGDHKSGEMKDFVDACCSQKIADCQISSWLMATCISGLSDDNLLEFTSALSESGKTVSFPFEAVDKHSTGGVGDKLTLLVVPIAASCGAKVAKLSGRGLGFTGGTVDKLEAIPGFNISLSADNFVAQVEKIGCAISGHSSDLAPAEAKFYALRDITSTLSSVPLIASSIVSKKVAGGARSIVYDVKCGDGAFMQTLESAKVLAKKLVSLSKAMGLKSVAVISDMSQPLGVNVGNSLEVIEALETLRGHGPSDVYELAAYCAGAMIYLSGNAPDLNAGVRAARESMGSGAAIGKFQELITEQGGVKDLCESPLKYLKAAPLRRVVECKEDGYIASINTRDIGECVKRLGGGRIQKGNPIDIEVGVRVLKKRGDKVSKGEPLMEIYANDDKKIIEAEPYFDVFSIGKTNDGGAQDLIFEVIQ